MISVNKKVTIKDKSPQQLFDFFLTLNKGNYVKAAPNNHIDFKVIKPVQSIIGSTYFFHEKIGRLELRHTWIVTDAKKGEYIFQKAQFFYPVTIEIYLKKIKEGTELTQIIFIGFRFFGLEKLVDWFAKLFVLTPSQIEQLHKHTQEEFTNWGNMI